MNANGRSRYLQPRPWSLAGAPAALIIEGEPHGATTRKPPKLSLLDLWVAILFKASFLITCDLQGILATLTAL